MRNDTIEALEIHPEGLIREITIDRRESLRILQDTVGGYIEAVYGWTEDPEETAADVTFFINDEGKLTGLPQNRVATALWWAYDERMVDADYLSGVVVVTGGADKNGDTLSVPQEIVEVVKRLVDELK